MPPAGTILVGTSGPVPAKSSSAQQSTQRYRDIFFQHVVEILEDPRCQLRLNHIEFRPIESPRRSPVLTLQRLNELFFECPHLRRQDFLHCGCSCPLPQVLYLELGPLLQRATQLSIHPPYSNDAQ